MGPANLVTDEDLAVRNLAYNGGFGTVSFCHLFLEPESKLRLLIPVAVPRSFPWHFRNHRTCER